MIGSCSTSTIPGRCDRWWSQTWSTVGVPFQPVRLHDTDDALYRGVEYYARLPIAVTGRGHGHGQTIPWGVGSIPVAILVHDKLRYFLDDIGHPELGIDPWVDGFEQRLYDTVTGAHQSADTLRAELAAARARLFEATLTNLVAIYRALTGVNVDPSFRPCTSLKRRLAEQALVLGARARTATTSPSPTSAA